MPQFEFSRLKSVISNSFLTTISPGTVADTDDSATGGQEFNFLPMNHSSITPVIFVVGGCNVTVAGNLVTTNLPFGFANARVGDAIALTTPGTAAFPATTIASVISLTQITTTAAPTLPSTVNASVVTITPYAASCTLTANSTTITTTVVNGFDRIQPGDSVSFVTGTGTIAPGTTVVSVLNTSTIVVSNAPGAGIATLSFSPIIGGCTVTASNPVVTTTVPGGFSRVRPGDTVALDVANAANLGTATVVLAVNSPTSITLGSLLLANGTPTAASPTASTTTGQTSSLRFTPVAIAPTAWGIRLLYLRSGSVVTIRPTLYLYDGSLGVVTGTPANATSAINFADTNVDLDTFYNGIRVTRSV